MTRVSPSSAASARRQIDQSRPGQHPLVRHVPEAALQTGQDRRIPFVVGRERDVAAFARDGVPDALDRQQSGDAEPGPRPEHRDRRCCLRRVAAELNPVGGPEPRHRQRLRGEVVDDRETLQAEGRLGRPHREGPGRVGQMDPIRIDVGGHREHRMGHLPAGQVSTGGFDHAWIGGHLQPLLGLRLPVRPAQREARIGAADVRDQAIHAQSPAATVSSPNEMPRPRAV